MGIVFLAFTELSFMQSKEKIKYFRDIVNFVINCRVIDYKGTDCIFMIT